jgi:hypothetical protein
MLLLQRKVLDFQVFLCLLDVGGVCLQLLEVGTNMVDLAHQLQGLVSAGIKFLGEEVPLLVDLPL